LAKKEISEFEDWADEKSILTLLSPRLVRDKTSSFKSFVLITQ